MTLATEDTTVQPSADPAQAATAEQAGGPDLKELLALQERVTKGELIEVTRYQGLQGTLAKEQTAKTAAIADAQAAKAALEAYNIERASLETQLSELTTFKSTAEPEIQTRKQEVARLRLLVNEFPGLVEFEKEDLLPKDADEAVLRTKLTAFQTKVDALKVQSGKQFRTGSVPEKSGAGETDIVVPENTSVISALQSEAYQLAFKGDAAAYDKKLKQIEELKAKQAQ